MSQFETNPYSGDPPSYGQTPQRNSGMAITSLVSSLLGLFCCPFIGSIVAVFTGAIGVATIGKDPAKKGKGLAASGLLLGLVGLVLWTVATVFIVRFYAGIWAYIQEGPQTAMTMLANDDIQGFKGEFLGAGARAGDDEVAAFKAELDSRYGAFQSATLNMAGGSAQPQIGQTIVPMQYRLVFDSGTVDAEIELSFLDEQTGQMAKKLWRIRIIDPNEPTDLIYPPVGP